MQPYSLSLALFLTPVFVCANDSNTTPKNSEPFSVKQEADNRSDIWGTKFAILPVPVTDDALGKGLGLTAMYIHDRAEGADNPSTSFAYGQYTDSDSGMLILGHEHIFAHDAWRAEVYAGQFGLNLNYYGSVGARIAKPIKYASGSSFLYGTVKKQIVDDLYVGIQSVWSGGNVTSNDSAITPEEKQIFEESMSGSSAAAGLLLTFDTRDNMMGATKGLSLDLSTMHYKARDTGKPYHRVEASFQHYIPVMESDVFAYRFETIHLAGNVPIYEMATPQLRGVNWNQAHGDAVYQAQAEYRHTLDQSWSLVGFAGVAYVTGKKYGDNYTPKSELVPAGGVGIRYMLDPKEKFSVGADVAVSRGGHTSYYIRFGEAF